MGASNSKDDERRDGQERRQGVNTHQPQNSSISPIELQLQTDAGPNASISGSRKPTLLERRLQLPRHASVPLQPKTSRLRSNSSPAARDIPKLDTSSLSVLGPVTQQTPISPYSITQASILMHLVNHLEMSHYLYYWLI